MIIILLRRLPCCLIVDDILAEFDPFSVLKTSHSGKKRIQVRNAWTLSTELRSYMQTARNVSSLLFEETRLQV